MPLPHEKFASKYEGRRERFENSISEIRAGVAEGKVWNAALTDAKQRFSSTFSDESSKARELMPRVDQPEGELQGTLWQAQSDLYWLLPLEYRHLPSALKKLPKTLEAGGFKDHPQIQESAQIIRDLAERWAVVNDLLEAAKPLIVKGRAPMEESDRKTPLRTIDNTGTCSCCSRNMKLEGDQQIVQHGFEVKWHQQVGSCFGVGYKPIELSPEGAEAYLRSLKKEREFIINKIADLRSGKTTTISVKGRDKTVDVGTDHPRWADILERTIDYDQKCLRECESFITFFDKRVKEWKPRPLPDAHLQKLKEGKSAPEAQPSPQVAGAPEEIEDDTPRFGM